MNNDGDISDEPGGMPVVRAALVNEKEAYMRLQKQPGEAVQFEIEPRIVYALIDTGAENNYADASLIAHAACPKIGTSQVHGATSAVESTWHEARIWFPDTGQLVNTDVFSTPLSDNGRKYPLVIGILTIKLGHLVLDYKSRIFRLHLG